MSPNTDPVISLTRDRVEAILTALQTGAVCLTTDGQYLMLDFFARNPTESELSARFDAILGDSGSTLCD